MTSEEFAAIEKEVRASVARLESQTRREQPRVVPWHRTILDDALFKSLVEDPRIGAYGAGSPEQRAVAIALVLLGDSVVRLGAGAWGNPMRSAPPLPGMIDDLARCLVTHVNPADRLERAPQLAVACLLDWRHAALPNVPSEWRAAAEHLLEFVVRSVISARVNWLKQLDSFLQGFDQHPILVGTEGGEVGVDRIARQVVSRLLDAPACDHWVLQPSATSAPTLTTQIDAKRAALDAMIRAAEEAVERAHAAGDEAVAATARASLATLRRKRRQGTYLSNAERAFRMCRRQHTLQGWDPNLRGGVGGQAGREGIHEDLGPCAPEADLWAFLARAVGGVASPYEFVVSAACTANADLTNQSPIFRHWERYAQAFAGALLFHALNARHRELLWTNVVHWWCAERVCQDWRIEACPKPPSPNGCGFAPRPEDPAIVSQRFVRRDFIGAEGLPFKVVPVWFCHARHTACVPLPGREPDESPQTVERKVQAVFAARWPVCPWPGCQRPHGTRLAKVLVTAEHQEFI